LEKIDIVYPLVHTSTNDDATKKSSSSSNNGIDGSNASSMDRNVFVSSDSIYINCGETMNYTDPTTGVVWLADRYYDNGRIRKKKEWSRLRRSYSSTPSSNTSNNNSDPMTSTVFNSYRTAMMLAGGTSQQPPQSSLYDVAYNIPVFKYRRKYKIVVYFYDFM
jgi:hypothetical protein